MRGSRNNEPAQETMAAKLAGATEVESSRLPIESE
jgi:hypothetical protein